MGEIREVEARGGNSGTRTTAVYERLRREIIQGVLLPGEKLRIDALRQRYNVGGSPLREALNRLSAEGLVSQSDQKGFRVTPVGADELLELTRTRCWINEVALRESVARGNQAWEEGVLLAFHRLSRIPDRLERGPVAMNPEWSQQHQEFHASLIAGCESRWMVSFNDLLFDCAERYRYLVAVMGSSHRDVIGEHRAIMQAAVERKTDLAVGLLNEHYNKTTESLLRSLAERNLDTTRESVSGGPKTRQQT